MVKPSGDREDASMRGDAFVVGEKAGPPGTPTVLFYASYGTVDESQVRERRRGGGEGVRSDRAGLRWTVCAGVGRCIVGS